MQAMTYRVMEIQVAAPIQRVVEESVGLGRGESSSSSKPGSSLESQLVGPEAVLLILLSADGSFKGLTDLVVLRLLGPV